MEIVAHIRNAEVVFAPELAKTGFERSGASDEDLVDDVAGVEISAAVSSFVAFFFCRLFFFSRSPLHAAERVRSPV